jgi:4-cresol dehydrogenase (hydroxylating)
MFIAIMYDRLELDQDQKAMECHNQLLEFLMRSGYIPYRLGIQSMSCLSTSGDNYNQLLKNIKQELDPNNILAPGRYQTS